MVKLSLVVAALLVASVAATRVQAQSAQFVSDESYAFVQGDPVPSAVDADAPVAVSSTLPSAFAAPAPAPAPVATGPSTEAASLSPRFRNHDAAIANAMRRPSRGSGVGLMIFGGAALITGLIIGGGAGTVIAVGGAIVGLYGLYVYLGRPTGMRNDGQALHSERIGLGYKLKTNF